MTARKQDRDIAAEGEAMLDAAGIRMPTAVQEISPELRARIARQMKSSLEPVRPLPSPPTLALQFAGVFALLALVMVALMGTAGIAALGIVPRAAILLVLAAGVALFSISLAWQMAPGSLARMRAGLVIDVFACGFLVSAALLFPWRESNGFFAEGWPCLMGGLAMAIPAGILFALLLRRGAPRASGILGGTLGAMAGLLGVTVLEFQCIHQSAPHLLVWHFVPLVLSIAAGAGIARLVERFSSDETASRV